MSGPESASLDIVVNGRFLSQRLTGVQRFAIETLKAMDRLLDQGQYKNCRLTVLVPPGGHLDLGLRNIAITERGQFRGYIWEQLELPILAKGRVLVSFCALGPIVTRRQLVVIHDTTFLAVPQSFTFLTRMLYRLLVPRLASKCDAVAAVSEFTRSEVASRLGCDAARIAVCGEGCDHVLELLPDRAVLDRLSLRERRFFLAVGVGGRNKNLTALLNAFAAAHLRDVFLLIVGKRNPRVHPDDGNSKFERVRYAGYVTDRELRALYEAAIGLVYPSTYEGFGLPPLEAMACGCPVIGSKQQALLEVSQGSALHIDVDNTEELGAAMRRLERDEALRTELARKGRERAAHFRWEHTARTLLRLCDVMAPERATK